MLALYRSGRQPDALDVYRRTREELIEFGIEPTAALRGLERAILSQDPSLDATDPLQRVRLPCGPRSGCARSALGADRLDGLLTIAEALAELPVES